MVPRALAIVRHPRLRLLLPFASLTLFATALGQFHADPEKAWEARMAGVVMVVLVLIGFGLPWRRLPVWSHPIVPLAFLGVIALLRDAHGGAASGYGPLCVMPVFWLALFGTRRQLALALAGVALLFVAPRLIVGAPQYPESEWRAALFWTLVLGIVGYRAQALVNEIKRRSASAREHARVTEEHARELAETQNALQSIALLAREISSTADARRLLCETALRGSAAAVATLVEPDGRGGFQLTGSAGIPIALEQLRSDVRPNASLRAFFSREPVFIPDVSVHEGISSVIIEATGVTSLAFEPILRDDKPVGILGVAWTEPKESLDERTRNVISFLAAEAGAVIERADLVAQLDLLAHTDQLTGVPNRRYWDEQLPKAIDAWSDGPLCVALVDLDHFKAYNDRLGHQAGDRLLRAAATAWRSQLRGTDLLARYGGEEFAVLLPGSPLADAGRVLERLRSSTPMVTCSAGVAQYEPGETPERFVERADDALYRAKRDGRNRLIAA